MRYLLTTLDAGDLRLTAAELRRWLAEADGAVVREVHGSPYAAADFSLSMADGDRLEGTLDSDGDAVWLQGTEQLVHVGAFAVWLREHLPAALTLLLADEGLRGAVVVAPGSDARSVIAEHIEAACAEASG